MAAGIPDGRRVTDGRSIDVVAPASTDVFKGALIRIDGFSGFALSEILSAEVERGLAIEVDTHSVWRVKVPAGIAATRGIYVKWSAGAGFKTGVTDLEADATFSVASVAKVEQVRGSDGYASLRLVGAA